MSSIEEAISKQTNAILESVLATNAQTAALNDIAMLLQTMIRENDPIRTFVPEAPQATVGKNGASGPDAAGATSLPSSDAGETAVEEKPAPAKRTAPKQEPADVKPKPEPKQENTKEALSALKLAAGKALTGLSRKNGNDAAYEVLAALGFSAFKEVVDAEDFASIIATCEAA